MELNKTYFYTVSIIYWKHLLLNDNYKEVIVSSLRYLYEKKLINVYAFVILPNHIHLIWELLQMNGKEMPHASFMKHTSHIFLEMLRKDASQKLSEYKVESLTRNHQFWQRDALPIVLYTDKVFLQKLNYIHNNPLQEKWRLSQEPWDYKYSSAGFYENGKDNFGFLRHFSEWQ